MVHLAIDHDGGRRVEEIVSVPGRVENDTIETEPLFARSPGRLCSLSRVPRRSPARSHSWLLTFPLRRCGAERVADNASWPAEAVERHIYDNGEGTRLASVSYRAMPVSTRVHYTPPRMGVPVQTTPVGIGINAIMANAETNLTVGQQGRLTALRREPVGVFLTLLNAGRLPAPTYTVRSAHQLVTDRRNRVTP